jgi:ketosteroid isomerase-like protein
MPPIAEKRMKNPSFLSLAALAISFAVPAFAQEKDTVDQKIAEQVRALATKYDEAFNQNDAAAIAALITEGAVWMTPHGTLSDRQAVQNYYADYSFRRYHCNNVSTKCDQVNKFVDDVDAIGTWSCTFQDGFGHTKHVKGNFTWIIVLQVDNLHIRANINDESVPY